MQNGETVLLASAELPGSTPAVSFSRDRGDTWSESQPILEGFSSKLQLKLKKLFQVWSAKHQ